MIRVTGRRYLHASAVRQDFFSWFSKKKKEPVHVQDQALVRPTKEIISEVERGEVAKDNLVSSKIKLDLSPEKFIGVTKLELKKKREQELFDTIELKRWLSEKCVETPEALEKIIDSAAREAGVEIGAPFPDIKSRFMFSKSLESQSGYVVPDHVLTGLKTGADIKKYFNEEIFSGKLARYKPSEPNAIHLTDETYKAPNIRVVDNSVPIKERKLRLKKLISTANELEAEKTRRLMEEAKTR
ncbi:Large ribosomal subunit protein mL50 [Nakaseomyces bracarensis]|uniref:Large ribosomal subunit protein mL50 n=1 Tax=Nakaseomyces bracarensis TaxID=273131 RepID=A0ABR4NMK0_9SACH